MCLLILSARLLFSPEGSIPTMEDLTNLPPAGTNAGYARAVNCIAAVARRGNLALAAFGHGHALGSRKSNANLNQVLLLSSHSLTEVRSVSKPRCTQSPISLSF